MPRLEPGRPRKRRWWIPVLAVVLLIGAVTTLLDDLEPVPPDDGGTVPATVTPEERMDRQERALYAIVPFYDCTPIPDRQLLPGAIAGIRCDTGPGRVEVVVTYQRFRTAGPVDRAYDARIRELRADARVDIVEDAKWCETTVYAPVCYGSLGRMVFYRQHGTVHVEWTSPGRIYGIADRADANMGRLRETWSAAGVGG
jgi:hypothetical protein